MLCFYLNGRERIHVNTHKCKHVFALKSLEENNNVGCLWGRESGS